MTTINSQEDFLQALRDNPAWREAVRAEILGEELLQLPVRFQAFMERMEKFITRQEAFNEQITQFVQEQKAFNAEQRVFNDEQKAFNAEQRVFNDEQRAFNERTDARFQRMESDISIIKAGHARIFGERAAEVIAMELNLEYVKTLTQGDLLRIYRNANGNLTPGERQSFRNADLVIEAARGDATVYIAAEISYTADHRDSDRALRNARLLQEYTDSEAIPTVVSVRNDHHVQALIDSGALIWHEMDDKVLETE